jgi:hypothetical protein
LCHKYINKNVLFDNSFSLDAIPDLIGNQVVLLSLRVHDSEQLARRIPGGNLFRHAGSACAGFHSGPKLGECRGHPVSLFFVLGIKKY